MEYSCAIVLPAHGKHLEAMSLHARNAAAHEKVAAEEIRGAHRACCIVTGHVVVY